MFENFISNYGISFWNGALSLIALNYWNESRVDINFQNYAILVGADIGRIVISNKIYTSLTSNLMGTV